MTGSVPFKLYRPLALNASGAGVAAQTISATLTMVASDDQFQRIDGGVANRDVTLPVAAPELKGCFFVINNVGTTNSLVLKNGASTIATLNFGEQGMAACNGTDWLVLFTTSSTATDIFTANGAYTGNNTHSGTETFSNAAGVSTDVITERTGATGVTIDGTLIKDGVVTANLTGNVTGNTSGSAGSCTGNAATATKLATTSYYSDIEQTGTGSEQIFAHSIGTTPSIVWHALTEAPAALGAGFDVAYGTMSSTELRFTVTSGIKYRVWAVK